VRQTFRQTGPVQPTLPAGVIKNWHTVLAVAIGNVKAGRFLASDANKLARTFSIVSQLLQENGAAARAQAGFTKVYIDAFQVTPALQEKLAVLGSTTGATLDASDFNFLRPFFEAYRDKISPNVTSDLRMMIAALQQETRKNEAVLEHTYYNGTHLMRVYHEPNCYLTVTAATAAWAAADFWDPPVAAAFLAAAVFTYLKEEHLLLGGLSGTLRVGFPKFV